MVIVGIIFLSFFRKSSDDGGVVVWVGMFYVLGSKGGSGYEV